MERTYDIIFLWLPYIYLWTWTCSWTTKSSVRQTQCGKFQLQNQYRWIPHCDWFLWGEDKSIHPEPRLTVQSNNSGDQFQHCNTDVKCLVVRGQAKQGKLSILQRYSKHLPAWPDVDVIRDTTGRSIGLGLEIPIGRMANKFIRALHVGHQIK